MIGSVDVDEGAEKQQLRGSSPDYIRRHSESVRATGSAYRWSSWTDFHLSFWYAKHWGEPRSDGCKDGGNTVVFVRPPSVSGEGYHDDNTALPFSLESKCWTKWAQFCWTRRPTQLIKWKWQPELLQDSPSARRSSLQLHRYCRNRTFSLMGAMDTLKPDMFWSTYTWNGNLEAVCNSHRPRGWWELHTVCASINRYFLLGLNLPLIVGE